MKLSVRDMILISMFAALTAVGAFIKIPIPYVPITLQFFFSALAGVMLGSKNGTISQIIYVLVGLAGFPIFTAGGGLGYIFQPTFGYLLGFIANAYMIGRIIEHFKKVNMMRIFCAVSSGLLMVYLIGVPYFYAVFNFYMGTPKSIGWVLKVAVYPFIWKDILVGIMVSMLALAIMPRLNKALSLGRNNFA